MSKAFSALFLLFLSGVAFATTGSSTSYVADVSALTMQSGYNSSSANYQADLSVDAYGVNTTGSHELSSAGYLLALGFFGSASRPPYFQSVTTLPSPVKCCTLTFSIEAFDDNGLASATLYLYNGTGANYSGSLYSGSVQNGVWRYANESLSVGNYTYQWNILSRDGLANASNTTAYVVVDNNPSRIYLTSLAAGVATNIASITWTTNRSSTSKVEYGTTTAYGTNSSFDSSYVTSHQVLLTGLAASTLYYYRTWSCDSLNNCNFSNSSFTTASPDGSLPPGSGSYRPTGSIGGGGGGSSGGAPPSSAVTPQLSSVLDASGDNPSKVTALFGQSSTTFVLSVQGGANGFSGSVSHRLPFSYSDYVSGLVSLSPAPSSAVEGSVLATWDGVVIPAGQVFDVTVKVGKKLASVVVSSFEKPKLVPAAVAPSATPVPEVATPTPFVEEVATPVPTVAATPKPVVKADAGFPLANVVIVVVVIAVAAFFLTRKRVPPLKPASAPSGLAQQPQMPKRHH